MSSMITVQLPEEILVDALRRLPPARRRQLLEQLIREEKREAASISAKDLDHWTGLIAIGGDALTDSERLYDD